MNTSSHEDTAWISMAEVKYRKFFKAVTLCKIWTNFLTVVSVMARLKTARSLVFNNGFNVPVQHRGWGALRS